MLKSWLDKAALEGVRPSKKAVDLVSELLIMYVEAIPDLSEQEDDIYDTAYELAELVLPEMPISRLITLYRDYLVEAVISAMDKTANVEEWQSVVRFSNVLSNAFTDARSDELRRTIRRDRIEIFAAELKTAKAIQRQLLPKVIPSIPGYEFAGRLIPAQEVGGDYWSIKHYEDDGVVTMKLADISGHGVAAATLVAAVKFISGCYYQRSQSAAEVMDHTNRILTRETPHDILVSMVYGWLRPETHQLTIVNAGHDPAFICREGSCMDMAPTGPVLGVMDTAEYGETTFDLQKGDVVFFGSDGITEAGIGERFGKERLKNLVTGNMDLSAGEIADTVVRAVQDFEPEPHDDISLLVTKVTVEPA